VEDWNWETIFTDIIVYIHLLWYNQPENLSNSVKKRKIRAITAFKVIQGHRGRYTKRKPVCNFLLAINITSYLVPFWSYCSLLFKFWTLRFLSPIGGLGTTYDVHLGLIGKRLVDFLLVLIELFRLVLRLSRYERKEIVNRRFRSNAASLIQNFRYKGSPPPIIFARIVRQMNAL